MNRARAIHALANDAQGVFTFQFHEQAIKEVQAAGGDVSNLYQSAALWVYWPPSLGAFPDEATIDAKEAFVSGADQKEEDAKEALNGGVPQIDILRLLKAKFVSDLAWRLGKAPGALTGAELTAERNRIAAIYKAI